MSTHINELKIGYSVEVKYSIDSKHYRRTTVLQLNQKYIVVPPVSSKQQNMLDRECIIIDFLEDNSGFVSIVKIRYIDNNRVGRMAFKNLSSKDSVLNEY